MNVVEFLEANRILAKPDSMTDEECGSLPVWSNDVVCVSCWQPTWKERLSMLLFGKVWLLLLSGKTQPPVAIWAERRIVLGKKEE